MHVIFPSLTHIDEVLGKKTEWCTCQALENVGGEKAEDETLPDIGGSATRLQSKQRDADDTGI